MKRRGFIIAGFAAISTLAMPAIADTGRINNQLMLDYVDWIVDHSDFEYNGEALPTITFRSTVELQRKRYGEERWEELTATGANLPKILALYDWHVNEILFNDDLDFTDWSNDHVIVHELVHYLQMVNETPYNCPNELEPDAYELQMKWQDQVGHPGERPDPFRLLMLRIGCLAL